MSSVTANCDVIDPAVTSQLKTIRTNMQHFLLVLFHRTWTRTRASENVQWIVDLLKV
jgi:hypothetical protein